MLDLERLNDDHLLFLIIIKVSMLVSNFIHFDFRLSSQVNQHLQLILLVCFNCLGFVRNRRFRHRKIMLRHILRGFDIYRFILTSVLFIIVKFAFL